MGFKNYKQHYIMDCGPTCLKMIARHYGKVIPLDTIREKIKLSKFGVTLFGIKEVAIDMGFECAGALLTFDQLSESEFPVIAHWKQNHFLVIYKIRKEKVYVSDPASGNKVYKKEEFLKLWCSNFTAEEPRGVILTMTPTDNFYNLEEIADFTNTVSLSHLFNYLKLHKRDVYYILIAIGISSIIQFIFPFLTQLIVDNGISNKDLNIVMLILLAQFALLLGRLFIEYVRGWLLLYVNSRINVTILSEFLIKLLKLPLSFFDTKHSGDILQRINDQRRIQDFLTGPSLEILFSLITIIVLSFTLFFYDFRIFSIFIISSVLYVLWSIYMLKARRTLDYKRFELSGENQSAIIQLINGIQDIKLNNSENHSRWSWEKIQSKLFNLNIDSLKISQTLQSGSFFLNEGKNILITYVAAVGVIHGQFTLGVMLAIQAIVGQLNGPISLLINLFQNFYETKLSIERLNEIHNLKNEEDILPEQEFNYSGINDLVMSGLDFAYPGTYDAVLKDVNIHIPAGKITAIVGSSGSGKTTLLKILLKFYENYSGEIFHGEENLKNIAPSFWRSKCGTVLQDGFIFSDTIANNIAIGQDEIDKDRLGQAIEVANIGDYITSLPLTTDTKIGAEGLGISQGQRQRILIARAVYKNPDFIFFDEATNALDANNESIITRNLEKFFKNKTVVIVAHRLSTVKNADQIIVMEKGRIIETGNHRSLVKSHGAYHTLVKNQLELDA